ncbi:MAG: hypothetical protein NC548_55080 [Lachnospiraceae bacterium]|nr:hypothetical protein [Acetatifactor muris]MCM1223607.1 hypothetical protein [Lachnospiraceae bacterium]MCM1558758.1 hypothetical protein [Butyrivibrio sp.]
MEKKEIELMKVQLVVEKELYLMGYGIDTIHEMTANEKLALLIIPRNLRNAKYRLLLSDDFTTSQVDNAFERYMSVLVSDVVATA